MQTLQKLVKQRKEAAEMYKSQNRTDLYDVEMYQVSIIEKYLPEQLSEEEIKVIIQQIIKECGATGIRDMGKVMGLTAKQLTGKADNKIVAAFVKELLAV